MPDLELNVFNQKIKLSYQQNEKEKLISAVEKLNIIWNKFSDLHGKVSDIKILTLITIELQDSIQDFIDLKNNLKKKEDQIKVLNKELDNKKTEINLHSNNLSDLKLELGKKDKEILKIENDLNFIHNALLEIKKNIIKK